MRAVGAIVGVLVLAVACSAPSDYRVVERDAELPREAAVAVDLGVVVDVPLGLPRDVALDDHPVAEGSIDATALDEEPVDVAALDASTVDEGFDAVVLDALVDVPSEDSATLDESDGGVIDDLPDASVDVFIPWDGDPLECEDVPTCSACLALGRRGAPCGFCDPPAGSRDHCRTAAPGGARPPSCPPDAWWTPPGRMPTFNRCL